MIEKTTIEFPRPIDREDAESLLHYISDNLKGHVSGKISYFINYQYDAKTSGSLEDRGTLKVSAMISNYNEPIAFDNFTSKNWEEDTSKIKGLEFQRVPDWELSDYRPEAQKLWDDTRKIVGNFFEQDSGN